jgi:hypothetical protein
MSPIWLNSVQFLVIEFSHINQKKLKNPRGKIVFFYSIIRFQIFQNFSKFSQVFKQIISYWIFPYKSEKIEKIICLEKAVNIIRSFESF